MVLFVEQVVAPLDIFGKLVAFDNGDFEIDSAELDDVINFGIVHLVLGLESLEDIVATPFVPEHQPHGLGEVYVILKFNLLVYLLLRHLMDIVGLRKLLLF